MANFSVGTAQQYDALNLLPAISTMSGGVRLNSSIPMSVGAKVEFSGLKFNELNNNGYRNIHDGEAPRYLCYALGTFIYGEGCSISGNNVMTSFAPLTTQCTGSSNLRAIFVNFTGADPARCISKAITVKDLSNAVLWKWLDQVSDYKTTPPNGTIVGTLAWFKQGADGNEMVNYLTQQLLISAVPNPSGHVVEVLDRSTPVDLLIAAGWVVQYTYAPSDGVLFGYNKLDLNLSLGF